MNTCAGLAHGVVHPCGASGQAPVLVLLLPAGPHEAQESSQGSCPLCTKPSWWWKWQRKGGGLRWATRVVREREARAIL